MIRFVLNKENLITRTLPDGLQLINTTDPLVIHMCISMFNSEIKWDSMFTVFDALRRIDAGERMFIGQYYGNIFGYCWVIDKDYDTYIYNVFSKTTEIPRQYGATDMLYYVIKNHGNKIISAKVDEWNVKSINVFKKLGFQSA